MTYDAGDYAACLDKALELADYKGLGARKAASAKNGKKRGLGFSAYIEACGIAPSAAVGSLGAGVGLWESAEVRVNPTGSVEVLTGSHSHGQGHETTFAQLASQRLGIPIEQVTVVHGDTDKVQFGMGTYGSRSGAVGMSAIYYAIDKVIVKAKKVAGFVLEVPEPTVDFKDGIFSSTATNKTLTFPEVALQAYIAHKFTGAQLEPGLKEGAFFDPTNFTFPSGVHICEVEIDPETGATRIDRWTAVDDFGTLINPMIVEGQVHGGIAQGVGQALLEGAVYDKEGQLLTASYMDYCMPRAGDLPSYNVAMPARPARRTRWASRAAARPAPSPPPPPSSTPSPTRWATSRSPCRRRRSRSGARPRKRPPRWPPNKEEPMYAFEYHRPQSLADAAKLLAGTSEAKLLAGGHTLIPTMKQRLANPPALIDLAPRRRAARHRQEGQRARHRRHDHARRGGELARACAAPLPACARWRAPSATRTCATAAPSAARSPTTIPPPTTRRRCWRSAPPSAPTSARSRPTTSSRACSRPRSATARSSRASPSRSRRKFAYVKFANPASRYALVGVAVAQTGAAVRASP